MKAASLIEGSFRPFRIFLFCTYQGILRAPRRVRMKVASICLNLEWGTPNRKLIGHLTSVPRP